MIRMKQMTKHADEDEDFRTSQRLTVLERGLLTAARFPLGP